MSHFPKFEGQMELFRWLWDTYPHICEITGKPIPFFSHWNFHHIQSKGAYPTLKLYPPNILICLPEVHHAIEMGNKIIRPDRAEYKYLDEMKTMLKRHYYDQTKLRRYH